MTAKIEGGHGEGFGTGLPNDVDYTDTEVRVAAFLASDADAACACVGYTVRTDYGTGIEHDVDRASCPVHGVTPHGACALFEGLRSGPCVVCSRAYDEHLAPREGRA